VSRLASEKTPAWREIGIRTALAILGGYALTYALTAALARLLPMPRYDAATVATLLSFAIYLLFILWSFGARSVRPVLLSLVAIPPLAAIGFWPQLLEVLG
jgi:hypothetical protein